MNYHTIAASANSTGTEETITNPETMANNNKNLPIRTAQSFTPRSLLVGLGIGTLIIFSNTYFGLQTGWMSLMTMPSSLIGFAVFKSLSKHLSFPFSPVENVLIQTVAGAVGTMPLGCGFVGVIPALEFLLREGEDGRASDGGTGEGGPMNLKFWKLVVWSLGVCLFGAIFAVPLRKEVIIREKLKFPSGTATALMIRMLHGESAAEKSENQSGSRPLTAPGVVINRPVPVPVLTITHNTPMVGEDRKDWRSKIRLLMGAFAISAFYTLFSYFVPQVRDVPIFGLTLARNWLWTLNPSPAYVGQGIIMGPSTSMHMLLGAVLGWAVLSPIAKHNGWAPGPVDDWTNGSKGWIIWVSLAIMLADSVINLGWLVLRISYESLPWLKARLHIMRQKGWKAAISQSSHRSHIQYSAIVSPADAEADELNIVAEEDEIEETDAPRSELISNRTIAIFLPLTLVLNVICMHIAFGDIITPFLSTFATLLAVLLSIMGVRALGETDLNPVSGISKLTQLIFSLVTPSSMHTRRSAVVTNLLAGAVSEAGALQAGDMMQDLKTGHILGASPKAQFYGQIIGSIFGAVVSTAVYKMYVNVYPVPGDQFQIPAAFVWIFTARLVTGQGLPPMAWQVALLFGAVFVGTTVLKIMATVRRGPKSSSWVSFIPGGIAVAVGMFNVPSFTLARAIGGVIAWWWAQKRSIAASYYSVSITEDAHTSTTADETEDSNRPSSTSSSSSSTITTSHVTDTIQISHPITNLQRSPLDPNQEDVSSSTVIVLASGLILGEGVLSIANLILASFRVPHL